MSKVQPINKKLIDQPLRTLTVCQGRETIGHIFEYAGRRFVAVLAGAADGDDNLGTFRTTTEAATVISDAAKVEARP